MPRRNKPNHIPRVLLAALAAVVGLTAAEYQGTIQSNGIPVPGATVTAVQGDRKIVTTSDEKGQFVFPDLADSAWTIGVERLGFGKVGRSVTSPAAAPDVIDLKLLSQDELLASLARKPVPPVAPAQAASTTPAAAPAASSAPVAPTTAGSPRTGTTPAGSGAPAGTPATGPSTAGATVAASTAATTGPGRGGKGGTAATPNADAFQKVEVNQLVETRELGGNQLSNLNAQNLAALNQSAANSFAVQGSLSSALAIPAQNDFGGGPGRGGAGVNALSADFGGIDAAPGGRGGGPGGGGAAAGGGSAGGGAGKGGDKGGTGGAKGKNGGVKGKNRAPADAAAFGTQRNKGAYFANISFQLSNSALDARSYSVTGANIPKPSYGQGRGGINFGGPIYIPKLLSAQKRVGFTVDYQRTRSHTGTISQAVNMPTALERTGDFSQTLIQGAPVTIYDPNTGQPFSQNRIPMAQLNQTSLALLKYFPDPNLPFAARNFQTSLNGVNNSQNLNIGINNAAITSKDRLSFRLGYQSGNVIAPNLFQFIDRGSNRSSNSNLGWSRRFTPRLSNNLAVTFSRTRQTGTPFFAFTQNVAADLGIQGTSQNPMNWGPPDLNFTNYGGLTDGTASITSNQTTGLTDTLSWSRGRHNLSQGTEYRRQQLNSIADSNGRGAYSFNGAVTSILSSGKPLPGTGYDLADFLLGMPATSSIRYGNPDKYFRGASYAAFVNDDFRMTSKLSWVFGVRWDYSAPLKELYNRIVNLDIAPGYTAVSPVQPNQVAPYNGLLPNTLVRPDKNNISPRVGVAWQPSSRRSMVVRAGYGVYYNTSIYNAIANNLAQQPPFAQTLSVSTSLANPLDIQTGFLGATSTNVRNTFAINPNYKTGYAQIWNLTLQNNLPHGMFFTAGYQGTKGTRLDQQFIPNSVAPGALVSALPNFFTYETSGGNSIYHAAQFQLNRRLSRGLEANVSYQFSKSIDNAGTGGRTQIAQNWLNLSAERALSSFNIPHNMAITFQYTSGNDGRGGGALVSGWRGAAIKDWLVSGNMNMRSGTPLTATVGGSNSQVAGTGVNNTVRANATGLPIEAAGMNFNTAAFSLPVSGQWGNAGRNTIPGPTMFTLNGQVGRIFRFGERRTADLQFQANNILNRVTVTNWGTVVGANNFGLINAAANMRKITTTLRFRF